MRDAVRADAIVPAGAPPLPAALICSAASPSGIHASIHRDRCPRCGWTARGAAVVQLRTY